MSTEYSDLKISPKLRDVLETAAVSTYGKEYRAISIAAHEAAIAYLILRTDPDVLNDALAEHGFESMDDLIGYLSAEDGGDGRFHREPRFDPLASLRTPRDLPDDETDES